MGLTIFALAMACFAMGCGIATLVLARGGSVYEKRRRCNHCYDDEDDD